MAQCGATPFDGRPDCRQKRNVVDRLGKEFNRARFHRLHSHGHVCVACNENDWHVIASGEVLLQFEPAEPRQCQVEDQTAREGATRVGEKLLCRRKAFGLPACCSNQPLERFACGNVAVNNDDGGSDVVSVTPDSPAWDVIPNPAEYIERDIGFHTISSSSGEDHGYSSSRAIHSRMYGGQLRRAIPFPSRARRNRTTSRSTRTTSVRSSTRFRPGASAA